jgi:hypothetical protein
MEALAYFPFTKLKLPSEETPVWSANNPTFHRTSDYGILLTDRALYLYSPFWLSFSRWRRLPLTEIVGAEFRDSRWFPRLRVKLTKGSAVLRTYPDYADEMDFDRKNLSEAAHQVNLRLRVSPPSIHDA